MAYINMDAYTAYICADCVIQGIIIYLLAVNGFLGDAMILGVAVAATGMVTKPVLAMVMGAM